MEGSAINIKPTRGSICFSISQYKNLRHQSEICDANLEVVFRECITFACQSLYINSQVRWTFVKGVLIDLGTDDIKSIFVEYGVNLHNVITPRHSVYLCRRLSMVMQTSTDICQ